MTLAHRSNNVVTLVVQSTPIILVSRAIPPRPQLIVQTCEAAVQTDHTVSPDPQTPTKAIQTTPDQTCLKTASNPMKRKNRIFVGISTKLNQILETSGEVSVDQLESFGRQLFQAEQNNPQNGQKVGKHVIDRITNSKRLRKIFSRKNMFPDIEGDQQVHSRQLKICSNQLQVDSNQPNMSSHKLEVQSQKRELQTQRSNFQKEPISDFGCFCAEKAVEPVFNIQQVKLKPPKIQHGQRSILILPSIQIKEDSKIEGSKSIVVETPTKQKISEVGSSKTFVRLNGRTNKKSTTKFYGIGSVTKITQTLLLTST